MRILLVGASGTIGQAVARELGERHEIGRSHRLPRRGQGAAAVGVAARMAVPRVVLAAPAHAALLEAAPERPGRIMLGGHIRRAAQFRALGFAVPPCGHRFPAPGVLWRHLVALAEHHPGDAFPIADEVT